MPYEFSIEPNNNLIRERYSGTVTLEDMLDCAKAEWIHPDYRRHMNLVCDFRGVDYTLTADEMRTLGQFLADGGPVGRTAVVVGSTLGRGLTRMFELTTTSEHHVWSAIRVFTDLDEAECWARGLA